MEYRSIQVLEKQPNAKGDLFNRLMSDFFHVLGYGEPRYNIHKSGREIDISADHRTEKKKVIAECKAQKTKIGGEALNKFDGVLNAERLINKEQQPNQSVIGYFVSLSGFTETAIEQEKKLDNRRMIMVDHRLIIDELVKGKVLVDIEHAIHAYESRGSTLLLINYCDVIAYDKGWIWALYYSDNGCQKATHVGFVHADGSPLISELVMDILSKDATIDSIFSNLKVIEGDGIRNYEKLEETRQKYYAYLEKELGDIHFEGLPADKDSGSIKVRLENIFVPLHLSSLKSSEKKQRIKVDISEIDDTGNVRENIGSILEKTTKLAILGKPGAGKSTLIKRIAIAYAFPNRREEISDKLPDRKWFPIFIRCRELGNLVSKSISEIINNIPNRAEIASYSKDFNLIVSNELQNSNALVLIDGLDEISIDQERKKFVNQLRTYISTYPNVNIIITSREVGFRIVGSSLADYCDHYKVASLINSEIEELCIKWHKAIIDCSQHTISDAMKVYTIIRNDERLRALATNPLLLTTLLFVKRWAGYLPTKKKSLYEEMIKLLLVTWNVEGHMQLELEEVKPQLAYIAFWMTSNNKQTITDQELRNCLINIRRAIPELLDYSKVSPTEFIKSVESRSSLLILAGHSRSSRDKVFQIYEFMHLSFQEYLTAIAIVERYVLEKDIELPFIEILKPNIFKENWKEVIPLVAVLLGRDSKDIIEFLIKMAIKSYSTLDKRLKIREDYSYCSVLGNCLVSEVPIAPKLLNEALQTMVKYQNSTQDFTRIIENIMQTKYSDHLETTTLDLYNRIPIDEYTIYAGSALSTIHNLKFLRNDVDTYYNEYILQPVIKGDTITKCYAILGMMNYCFNLHFQNTRTATMSDCGQLYSKLLELLTENNELLDFSIYWCLAWSLHTSLFPKELKDKYVNEVLKKWVSSDNDQLFRFASWALNGLLSEDTLIPEIIDRQVLENKIEMIWKNTVDSDGKRTALYLMILSGYKIDREEVIQYMRNEHRNEYENTSKILHKIGITPNDIKS